MRKFESYVQPMQIKRLITASSSRSLSKKSLFRIRSYTLADKFYKTNNRDIITNKLYSSTLHKLCKKPNIVSVF